MPVSDKPPHRVPGHWRAGEGDGRGVGTWVIGDDGRGPAGLVLPPEALQAASVRVDASAVVDWDTPFAAALWDRLAELQQRGVALDLQGLPDGLRAVIEQALQAQTSAAAVAAPARTTMPTPAPMSHAGPVPPQPGTAEPTAAAAWPTVLRDGWRDALLTVSFLGEVLLSLGRLMRGRSDMRLSDLWRQIDQTGPLSLPIVALTCFLVGLMLAYMGGAQLDRIGAQNLIADVVTVGMVREMAGLMTGVILSGRLGAAFAAQLASMQANEEIDALRAMGIDPVDHLVLPRLLALLIVALPLLAFASLVGVLAGLPPVVGVYGVPAAEYLDQCLGALTWTHLWIGLFKGTLYAALVALAGCREGLHAGRNAQAVGVATTAAVVKALVWIVTAASGTTVVFQSLGL